jgi:hypothetical protein
MLHFSTNKQKKITLLFSLIIIPFLLQAEDFDIGRFYFSLSPKIMEDGSITDIGIGMI